MSEIRSLYRDENDLFRTVLKRIWEEWDAEQEQWNLKRIEFIFEDPELPLPSDNPAIAVEQRHGWLIPPGMGVSIGGLGVRAEVSGAENRI